MSSSDFATIASACPLIDIASAEDLAKIHEASVIKHAHILAGTDSVPEKILNYFDQLGDFLKDNQFQGCPYTNALAATHGGDPEVVREVQQHKEFIREFFIALLAEYVGSADAEPLGEQLFLLYSGATVESQNLQDLWPVKRARQIAADLLQS